MTVFERYLGWDKDSHQEPYAYREVPLVFRYYNLDKVFVRMGSRNEKVHKQLQQAQAFTQASIQQYGRYFRV